MDKLGIGNIDFAVEQAIADAPADMALREMVQNGLEAKGSTWVVIGVFNCDGTPKLMVINDGETISREFMVNELSNLYTSTKIQALDANFGIGARITGLKMSPAGMLFAGEDEAGEYSILLTPTGYQLNEPLVEKLRDQTLVALMGKAPDHDTVSCPYEPGEDLGTGWIHEYMRLRYWLLPAGKRVRIRRPSARVQPFVPMGERLGKTKQAERVKHPTLPISYTFIFDPKRRLGGSLAALEYKGELHHVAAGHEWNHLGPTMGVIRRSSEISVIVHLDTASVRSDRYRKQLFWITKAGEPVVDWPSLDSGIITCLPTWLRRLIVDGEPTSTASEKKDREWAALQNKERKIHGMGYAEDSKGNLKATKLDGQIGGKGRGRNKSDSDWASGEYLPVTMADPQPKGKIKARQVKSLPSPIETWVSEKDAHDAGWGGLMVRYLPKEHTLMFNTGHPVWLKLVQDRQQEYNPWRDAELDRAIHDVCRSALYRRFSIHLGSIILVAQDDKLAMDEDESGKHIRTHTSSLALEGEFKTFTDHHYSGGALHRISQSIASGSIKKRRDMLTAKEKAAAAPNLRLI